jgi:hypothetical protein
VDIGGRYAGYAKVTEVRGPEGEGGLLHVVGKPWVALLEMRRGMFLQLVVGRSGTASTVQRCIEYRRGIRLHRLRKVRELSKLRKQVTFNMK